MLHHSTPVMIPDGNKEIESVNPLSEIIGIDGKYQVRANSVKLTKQFLFEIHFNNRFSILSTHTQMYRILNGEDINVQKLKVDDAVEGFEKTFFVSKIENYSFMVWKAFYSLSLHHLNNWFYVGEGVLTREKKRKHM